MLGAILFLLLGATGVVAISFSSSGSLFASSSSSGTISYSSSTSFNLLYQQFSYPSWSTTVWLQPNTVGASVAPSSTSSSAPSSMGEVGLSCKKKHKLKQTNNFHYSGFVHHTALQG